ncbi:MAG: chemotaxis protein CheB, partial [Planctomycetota bacterium]
MTSTVVVGIGASAGGLEAIETLFDHVPSQTQMAFVIVQHLSPDFDSMMEQLLQRRTKIPVQVIENEQELEPNQIYLLPPKKEVILSNDRLLLTERLADEHLSYPIDNFFRSLAENSGIDSVGIILSGTGSDGSRGIVDIHAAGGFVIAQDQESAKFSGMPNRAMETGVVDLVVPPEEIGVALLNAQRDRVISANDPARSRFPAAVSPILNRLNERYQVDFVMYKTPAISRRIERRMALTGETGLEEYARRIAEDDSELDRLYHDLLIGVTNFFRDEAVFRTLQQEVIPNLIGRLSADEEFRVWTAGCASGEESYSLAMIIAEHLSATCDPRPVRIFASDAHDGSLAIGSRGIYQSRALEALSVERRERFFIERSDGFHISPELRKMVVFTPHNVLRNAPFTRLDLITCRNMLIYLNPASQKKVLSLFHFGLRRGGALCLGLSESIGALSEEFGAINEAHRVYRKERDAKLLPDVFKSGSFERMKRTALPVLASSPNPTRGLLDVYDLLLGKHMPPSILVSSAHEVLHSFAGASKYLQPRDGRASTNIVDLVVPSLRDPLLTVMRQAEASNQKASIVTKRPDENGREAAGKGPVNSVMLTAERVEVAENTGLLIHFGDQPAIGDDSEVIQVRSSDHDQFEAVQEELHRTREELQNSAEQFQTTNEELQSANEELTSSNEELQSTNEELHSVNEELYTVNGEHQRKIDELTELTADMDNLLNSTNIHTVFLDRGLCLRRFTPGVAEIFSFIPQDIGRQFAHFSYSLKIETLLSDLREVLHTGQPFEREVRDAEHRWYLFRILPYYARDVIDGVVLTLVDITSLKDAQLLLRELSEVVKQSDDAIFRVDKDGTIRTWNRGAERLYGYRPEQAIGVSAGMLAAGRADEGPPDYLKNLGEGIRMDHVETNQKTSAGKILVVELTVSPLLDDSGDCVGASVVARDVSRQKQAEREIRKSVEQRDQFLAMLSHELRNPLAAIVNATRLLGEVELDDKTEREAREVADTQLKHIARLLDDLLDVARITNDKMTLHLEVVDMKKSMMDAIECTQHRFDAKRQRLFVESVDDHVFVKGDVGRLQQAQVNLLVNASKYSPEASSIHFSLALENADAVITVRDQGVGIAEPLASEKWIEDASGLYFEALTKRLTCACCNRPTS